MTFKHSIKAASKFLLAGLVFILLLAGLFFITAFSLESIAWFKAHQLTFVKVNKGYSDYFYYFCKLNNGQVARLAIQLGDEDGEMRTVYFGTGHMPYLTTIVLNPLSIGFLATDDRRKINYDFSINLVSKKCEITTSNADSVTYNTRSEGTLCYGQGWNDTKACNEL